MLTELRVQCFSSTFGRMLFSQGRVGLEITQYKIALSVQGHNVVFPRRSKIKKDSVKDSVKSAQGTVLFYQEVVRLKITAKISLNGTQGTIIRVKLKLTQSKLALTVHRIQPYSPWKK